MFILLPTDEKPRIEEVTVSALHNLLKNLFYDKITLIEN